jgi:hypothetical protein
MESQRKVSPRATRATETTVVLESLPQGKVLNSKCGIVAHIDGACRVR